jgi:hypothetical protein
LLEDLADAFQTRVRAAQHRLIPPGDALGVPALDLSRDTFGFRGAVCRDLDLHLAAIEVPLGLPGCEGLLACGEHARRQS